MSDSSGSDLVRRITITATGQGIDSTTQSVTDLGNAVDDINSKGSTGFSGLAMTIAGLGVATFGTLTAMQAFVDFVGKQSQALADLSDHAAVASMSTKEFQETMFAAMSRGVSQDDYSKGMDKIASDIVAASQGTTEFTKLLDANGMSINKNADDATKFKQTFSDIMTLMQNSTPAVAEKVASIVGLSQSWIPFLKEGTDQFNAQKQAAADLGLVIDDSTINKAKEFSNEWKTATATWEAQFKAAMGSVLPTLTKAADLAIQVLNGVGSASSDISRLWTSPDDMSTKQLQSQINAVEKYKSLIEQVGGNATTGPNGESIGMLQWMLGLPAGATIQDVDAMLDKLQNMYSQKTSAPPRLVVNGSPNATQLAPNSDHDEFSRASDQAQKRINELNAEAAATDLTAGAQAGLKTQADLLAAAHRAGMQDASEYTAKIAAMKNGVEAATDALNKAKIATNIKFADNTALLSPEDVQIATQLKSIYPDVATALNSAEASQLRLINDVKQFGDTARSAFDSLGSDMLTQLENGATGWKAFETAGVNALNKIADKLMQMATDKLWESAFGGSSASGLLGLFGLGGSSGVNSNGSISGAIGATSVNGAPLSPPMFASGTDNAPGGWSIVGEKGPELMNVPKGSQILPNGVMPGSATTVTVPISIDARGADSDGMARLQQQISNLQRSLPTTIVATVKSAQKRNAL